MALTVFDSTQTPALSIYRRPNLLWVSITQVQVESGIIDGNSSNTHVLFPDGQLRVANLAAQVVFVITRNAVFNGSNQSGLRTGLSEATNTWYAIYAVKEQNGTGWVLVGDTVLPLKANYATLNTNFGTNGWVYLGLIRNGDNSTVSGDILKFNQTGHLSHFRNTLSLSSQMTTTGMNLVAGVGVSSSTWAYASGTAGAVIPSNVSNGIVFWVHAGGAVGNVYATDSAQNYNIFGENAPAGAAIGRTGHMCITDGMKLAGPAGSNLAISVAGWFDDVLGIGPNPLL